MSVRLHLEPGPPRLHEHCVQVAGGPSELDRERYEAQNDCPYCQSAPTPPLGIPIQQRTD